MCNTYAEEYAHALTIIEFQSYNRQTIAATVFCVCVGVLPIDKPYYIGVLSGTGWYKRRSERDGLFFV